MKGWRARGVIGISLCSLKRFGEMEREKVRGHWRRDGKGGKGWEREKRDVGLLEGNCR